jgi:flagellar hook-associated protein 1 FlgK
VTEFTTTPIKIDGLDLTITGTAEQGDSFLLKPFSAVAATIATAFASPGALAMSSPVAARAGSNNLGTLALASLVTRSVPAPAAVTLTFTAPGTYTRSDTGATTYPYTAGQAIEYSPATATTSASGWSLTLKGAAVAGDTFVVGSNASVQPNADPRLNAGNALSLLALRDAALFEGSAMTDGYAGLMAQVGVMVQGASYAADVSQSIANNVEQDRSSVAGVNLDEEAAKLLQYQQAYQASAKMLQIAQGVFDALLQSLGR